MEFGCLDIQELPPLVAMSWIETIFHGWLILETQPRTQCGRENRHPSVEWGILKDGLACERMFTVNAIVVKATMWNPGA